MSTMSISAPPSPNVRALRSALGISRDRMGRLLELTPKTIERLEDTGRLPTSPLALARLARIREIVELGLIVYTPDGFRLFVTSPLPAFEGLSTLQLIERDQAERVLAALAADYEGVSA